MFHCSILLKFFLSLSISPPHLSPPPHPPSVASPSPPPPLPRLPLPLPLLGIWGSCEAANVRLPPHRTLPDSAAVLPHGGRGHHAAVLLRHLPKSGWIIADLLFSHTFFKLPVFCMVLPTLALFPGRMGMRLHLSRSLWN